MFSSSTGSMAAMGTLIRWATLAAVAVFAYLLLSQRNDPARPGESGIRGALARLRQIGRKVQLVALIYVLTIVISAVLRVAFGWGM